MDHAPGAHDDRANAVAGVAFELCEHPGARFKSPKSYGENFLLENETMKIDDRVDLVLQVVQADGTYRGGQLRYGPWWPRSRKWEAPREDGVTEVVLGYEGVYYLVASPPDLDLEDTGNGGRFLVRNAYAQKLTEDQAREWFRREDIPLPRGLFRRVP